jgi:hypothetical protein
VAAGRGDLARQEGADTGGDALGRGGAHAG